MQHAKDYDNALWLPYSTFLDSPDSVPAKGLEKTGIKQNNPAAKSGEMKPKTDVTFKEYINDTIKCHKILYLIWRSRSCKTLYGI